MKFKKRKYKIGDRVRIVSKWAEDACVNDEGLMDKWLGKVMTVRAYESLSLYRMEEDKTENDGGGWYWDDGDIAGLAEEFEKVDNPTPEKIIITTDGRTTKARHYTGKELTGEAVAVRSPSDSFDFKTGARIAIDRLLGAESKVEPLAEPKFKPGDVVVVKGCTDVKHYYPANSLAIVQEIKADKEPEILSPYAYLCLGCDHNGELEQVVGEVDLRLSWPRSISALQNK